MNSHPRNYGTLRPIGGGDPIPLLKSELVIGRRPSCDIRLDFENISGKHCELRFVKGVWHIRDLKSTNGTFVNRQKVDHEHGVMPDDEVRIATHLFTIDYEPAGGLVDANAVLEEGIAEMSRSLTELAGIEDPDRRPARRSAAHKPAAQHHDAPAAPAHPQLKPQRTPAPEPEPDRLQDAFDEVDAPALPLPSEEDFLAMIESDLGSKKGSKK